MPLRPVESIRQLLICRHFVAALMQRLVRLSYHDRIAAAVPQSFHALLPPRPAVEALPPPDAADAANGAAALEDLQASTAAELVQMVSRGAFRSPFSASFLPVMSGVTCTANAANFAAAWRRSSSMCHHLVSKLCPTVCLL